MSKPYKRKMSNLLLDKRFQLKFTLFMVLVSVAIFSVLGWLYWSEMKASTELMEINQEVGKALDVKGLAGEIDPEYLQELEQDVQPEVATRDTRAFYIMIGAIAGLVLVLALTGIFMTHKVAGPLYALGKFMQAARQGHWSAIRPFRKGDEFIWLSEQFQLLAQSIKDRHRGERETLRAISENLASGNAADASAKLAALIQDKERYIEN